MFGVFVGFSRVFLLGILIFRGLTAPGLYKSFGLKGLVALAHFHTPLFIAGISISLFRNIVRNFGSYLHVADTAHLYAV
jgi:hypothetical protein